MRINRLTPVVVALLLAVPSMVQAQSSGGRDCRVNDYSKFTMDLMETHAHLTNVDGDSGLDRFTHDMLMESAEESIRTCPGYVSRIIDGEMPYALQNAQDVQGALMRLLVGQDDSYQALKDAFPAFQRWVRRIRDRIR